MPRRGESFIPGGRAAGGDANGPEVPIRARTDRAGYYSVGQCQMASI